jgi:hypothetical protein
MSSLGSEQQREERPVAESDGHTSRDEEYAARATQDRGESVGDPDVLLDVPKLNVEEIDLEVEDLQVRIAFLAELADLVKINVGLDVEVREVKLQIKGVEAQAQLKARLDNVRAIFSEVLSTLQHSPQFFRQALGPPDQPAGTSEDAMWNTDIADESDGTEEPEATEAARKKARELGVDLSGLDGTGSGGRIVVRDVTKAAKG